MATRTWDGGGGDNLASNNDNWDAAPSAGDNLIFDATSSKDCTWDITTIFDSIDVQSGYTGTITQTATMNVTTSPGSLTINPAGTFDANGQNVNALSLDLSGSATKTVDMGEGVWTISGDTNLNGSGLTLNEQTSELHIDATATFTTGGETLYKLSYGGSAITTITHSGDVTVTNTLDTNAGTQDVTLNGGNINAQGDIDYTNTTANDPTSGTTNLNITGSATQTWNSSQNDERSEIALDVTINKSGGSLIFNTTDTVYLGGNFTHTAGTVTTTNSTVSFQGNQSIDSDGIDWNNIEFNGHEDPKGIVSDMQIDGLCKFLDDDMDINNSGGDIICRGDIEQATSHRVTGTAKIIVQGDGAQAFRILSDNNPDYFALAVDINKASGGTVTFSGTTTGGLFRIAGDWTFLTGSVEWTGVLMASCDRDHKLDISGMPIPSFTFLHGGHAVTLGSNLIISTLLKQTGAGNYGFAQSGSNDKVSLLGNCERNVTDTSDWSGAAPISIEGTGNAQSFNWGTYTTGGSVFAQPLRIAKANGGTLTFSGHLNFGAETTTYVTGTVDFGTSTFDHRGPRNYAVTGLSFNNFRISTTSVAVTFDDDILNVDGDLIHVQGDLGSSTAIEVRLAGNLTATTGNGLKTNDSTRTFVFDGGGPAQNITLDPTGAGSGTLYFKNFTITTGSRVVLQALQTSGTAIEYGVSTGGVFTASGTGIQFQSDDATARAIWNVVPSATQFVSLVSATRIDSSGGQTIVNENGALLDTLNWSVGTGGVTVTVGQPLDITFTTQTATQQAEAVNAVGQPLDITFTIQTGVASGATGAQVSIPQPLGITFTTQTGTQQAEAVNQVGQPLGITFSIQTALAAGEIFANVAIPQPLGITFSIQTAIAQGALGAQVSIPQPLSVTFSMQQVEAMQTVNIAIAQPLSITFMMNPPVFPVPFLSRGVRHRGMLFPHDRHGMKNDTSALSVFSQNELQDMRNDTKQMGWDAHNE